MHTCVCVVLSASICGVMGLLLRFREPLVRVQREGRPEQGLLMMFVPGEKGTRPSPGPCMLCVWLLSCESARTRVTLDIVSADEKVELWLGNGQLHGHGPFSAVLAGGLCAWLDS